MLRQNRPIIGIIRILSLLLVLVLIQAAVLPLCARAEDGKSRVVRVGWFESPYSFNSSYASSINKSFSAINMAILICSMSL